MIMKRRILKLSAVILTAVVMTFNISCNKDETDADVVFSINPKVRNVVFNAEGFQAYSEGKPISSEFKVVADVGAWEVTVNQSWLHFIKLSHGFILYADPNISVETLLKGEVTVTSGNEKPITIGIQQHASGVMLKLSPSTNDITIASEGGSEVAKFIVTTNVDEWNVASSDESWLTVDKSETGFTLAATQNAVVSERETEVIISASGANDVVIRVSQEGNFTVINFNEMSLVGPTGTDGRYGDLYQIEMDIAQGGGLRVINVPNVGEWWIDPTFFDKIADDKYVFVPMSGRYNFRAYPALKLFAVNPVDANMQPDGTGGVWLKGTSFGKPRWDNIEVGWGTADRIPMARMGEKINRMIFVAGETVRDNNAMIYFHYQDNDWAPTLANITNATPDLLWFWEGDTGFIFTGTLEAGETYELIVDTSAGLENPVMSLKKID